MFGLILNSQEERGGTSGDTRSYLDFYSTVMRREDLYFFFVSDKDER